MKKYLLCNCPYYYGLISNSIKEIDSLMLPSEASLNTFLYEVFAKQVNAWFEVTVDKNADGTLKYYQADPRTDGNSNFGFTGLEATCPDQQHVLDLVGDLTSSNIDVFLIANEGTFLVQNEELAHGLTNRTSRTCWVLGRPSGNYNDPDDVLSTIAHEIGHMLVGYGHPDVQGGPAPLSGTDRTKRLLCSGPNRSLANGKLLVKKEWDGAEEWLIGEERERRMAP